MKRVAVKIKDSVENKDKIPTSPTFPLYTSYIINQANRNAQGTRAKIVGQMSELVKQFQVESSDKSYNTWVKWYLGKHPEAIGNATEKVYEMVQKFNSAMEKIDQKMVETWVSDLVLAKTYVGLIMVQETILKKIAEEKKTTYRLATPEEESKGIDGYVGNKPISIKPTTYKTKVMLIEKKNVDIIYYEKDDDTITFEYDF